MHRVCMQAIRRLSSTGCKAPAATLRPPKRRAACGAARPALSTSGH